MMIQLSSGMGPAECELAVARLYKALEWEYPDCRLIRAVPGKHPGTFLSVLFSTDADLSALNGSVLWKCQSPYRPGHKRKNWYVDVSVIEELDKKETKFDEDSIRFETFRCGGKGGQNVNKVETGARVIHIPTGIAVESTTARSQHMNKKLALNRLCQIIAQADMEREQQQKQLAWAEHARLERGNPVRIYVGENFKREDSI